MTTSTIADLWPFFDLTISTPRISLRYPTDDIIAELVEQADDIHSPGASPFMGSWSIDKPEVRATSMLQFQWQCRATISPEKWQLPFAVVIDDEVAGVQDAFGVDFHQTRVAKTGSWLNRKFQGQGFGTEARRAVLHFIFEGLDALIALTDAFESNAASLRVTEKLGYQPNGETIAVRGDEEVERAIHYRYERADWEANLQADDITITGLEPCLPFLGL